MSTLGRSGCVIPADTLVVNPKHYRFLDALLDDAVIRHRRTVGTLPDDVRLWLADLHDLAASMPPLEPVAPSTWITVDEAAVMFADAGVKLGVRQIRAMAHDGKLVSRRDGHRRLVALDAVVEEIDARVWSRQSRQSRQCPGSRDLAVGAESGSLNPPAAEEAS